MYNNSTITVIDDALPNYETHFLQNDTACFETVNDDYAMEQAYGAFSYASTHNWSLNDRTPTYLSKIYSLKKDVDVLEEVKSRYVYNLQELFPTLATRLGALAKAQDGWDGQDARCMSFESFGQLRRFLYKTEIFADDIGLYLEPDGAIILSYTDKDSNLTDLTFYAEKIIVCSDISEDEMTLEDAIKLVKSSMTGR